MADIRISVSAEDQTSPIFEKVKAGAVRAAGEVSSAFANLKTIFGEFAEQAKSTVERSLTIWGLALATGIAAAVFSALYAAYKSIDFGIGLITGESYKSVNIDALVKTNKAVVTLQESLQLTAVDANVLNETLTRLGLTGSEFSAVYEKSVNAIRTNGAELDRLGVKYKAANGALLANRDILVNAKTKLEEYTDGWDRNQAATALGMGNYKQITDYLKINQDELKKSKLRLDDYNLGIGTDTQTALSKFQTAVTALNEENRLFGEGLKRVIADNIMPGLTILAEYFTSSRDDIVDWGKLMVDIFRGAFATVTTLIFSFKISLDAIGNAVVGTFTALGSIIYGVVSGAWKAVKGDFSGAKRELVGGLDDARIAMKATADSILADTERNKKAIAMAWGDDNRAKGNGNKPATGGKAWTPAPAAAATTTTAVDEELENLKKQLANRLTLYKTHNEMFLRQEELKYSLLLKMEQQLTEFVKTNLDSMDKQIATFVTAWKSAYDTVTGIETTRKQAREAAATAALSDFEREQQAIQGLIDRQRKLQEISDATEQLKEAEAIAQGWDKIATAVDNDINKITLVDQNIGILRQSIKTLGDEHTRSLIEQKNALSELWYDAQIKANDYQQTLDLIKGGLEALNNSVIKIGFEITGLDEVQNLIDLSKKAAGITAPSSTTRANPVSTPVVTSSGSTPFVSLSALSPYGGGRYSGGPVAPGTAYTIGERGPETLVMGNQGGMIIPNGGVSYGGVNITINAGTTNDPGTLAKLVFGKLQQLQGRIRA